MTAEYDFAFSQHDLPEVLYFVCPPRNQRAQGRPGARRTRGLACICIKQNAHTSIQVWRKHSGLPCAMALQLIRGRPGDRLCCHHRFADCSAKLDASTGASDPHDFAVRVCHARLRDLASTASHPALVTIAKRPPSGTGPNRYIRDLGQSSNQISENQKLDGRDLDQSSKLYEIAAHLCGRDNPGHDGR